jgi:hypothetical protein
MFIVCWLKTTLKFACKMGNLSNVRLTISFYHSIIHGKDTKPNLKDSI